MAVLAKGSLFPVELEKTLFNKVKGHSSLVKMSASEAVPFCGKDIFTFSFTNHLAVVGESGDKPVGDASIVAKTIKPIKVVYQERVSDEFMYAAEEKQIEYLQAFTDGFAKELGRGLDIMALHGFNPNTNTAASTIIGNNHFDYEIQEANTIAYAAANADTNIDDAVAKVEGAEYEVNGCIIAPVVRSDLAKLTTSGKGRAYAEFAFGGCPDKLGAMTLDSNATVSVNGGNDRAYVGDFKNCFRWGIAKEIPLKVIEYGNPDGQGDLQAKNQVVLRAEAYIGWAIMDNAAFAKVAVSG